MIDTDMPHDPDPVDRNRKNKLIISLIRLPRKEIVGIGENCQHIISIQTMHGNEG